MRQRGMSSHCGPSPRKCPFGFDTGGGRGGPPSKVDQGTSWGTENPSTRSPLRPRRRGAPFYALPPTLFELRRTSRATQDKTNQKSSFFPLSAFLLSAAKRRKPRKKLFSGKIMKPLTRTFLRSLRSVGSVSISVHRWLKFFSPIPCQYLEQLKSPRTFCDSCASPDLSLF